MSSSAGLILLLLLGSWLGSGAQASESKIDQAKVENFAFSHSWLRLYQYRKSGQQQFQSPVEVPAFFFSNLGQSDPLAELQEALKAYHDPKIRFGILKMPAACAFPARKKVIERELGLQFSPVDCPDLDQWRKGLRADRVSLVFAGAYAQNPASMFGHTLLRFYSKESDIDFGGDPLLSYAVGFLARPQPDDSPVEYIVNGVTGGYPGFYEIGKFYTKFGVYSHSESRDLWERRLKLTPDETQLLILHLWEMGFNASIDYYFAGRNCSYRLLTLIEGIKPDLDLSSDFNGFTLPAETVRAFDEVGLLEPKAHFYPSLLRKNKIRVNRFTPQQRSEYFQAKKNLQAVSKTGDPDVLDTLIQHWTHQNYKVNNKLEPEKALLMNATFEQRAKVESPSSPLPTDDEISEKFQLLGPEKGHRSRWWGLTAGTESSGKNIYGLRYRSGAHAFYHSKKGYDQFAAIEALGFDLSLEAGRLSAHDWKILVANVKSTEDMSRAFPDFSWQLNFDLRKNCELCLVENGAVNFQAGGGVAQSFAQDRALAYVMPIAELNLWREVHETSGLALGIESGLKFELHDSRVLVSGDYQSMLGRSRSRAWFLWSADLKTDWNSIVRVEKSWYRGDETRAWIGFENFF